MDISALLTVLHEKAERRQPIISTGCGTGFSAASMDRAGCDLLVVYTSSYYRMRGRSSMASTLPCGDANAIIESLASEILPVIKRAPVIAGVLAADPFRPLPALVARMKELGYAGVQNYPTAGQIDGVLREALEEAGLGYETEIALVAEAKKQGLLTQPYAFNETEAEAMAAAGCDLLIAHMGIQTKTKAAREGKMTLDDAAKKAARIADAAHAARKDVLVLCHGGPINLPEDLAYVMRHAPGVAGIYGASVAEYNPASAAIGARVEEFLSLAPFAE